MSFFQRTRRAISELIGRTQRIISLWSNQIWSMRPSFDWSRVDYVFYDKLWRGKAAGLEKSGLLVAPIVSKLVAWVFGQLPKFVVEGDEAMQKDLNDWMQTVHATITRGMLESGKLGDSFLVLNGDGSLSLMPPDVVFPIVDEENYSNRIGWRVVAVYQHPEKFSTMKIIDEYTAEKRVRIIQKDGATISSEEYPNPLGRVAVVHIPNMPGVNDLFGHPEAEPLLPLLHDYGQILDAGLDGNYKQGRPLLNVNFADLQSLEKFWSTYGKTKSQTLTDGTVEKTTYLDVTLEGVVTTANATVDWKAPGSSSADTIALLEILYYLVLENKELPEFLMGTAIASSKASAETQMPPFVMYIALRQLLNEGWLIELALLGLAYLRAVKMRRMAAASTPKVRVIWPRLTGEDNRLTLDTLKWAVSVGLLDDENAIRLMPLEVENPEAMLAKLKAGAAERVAQDAEAQAFEKGTEQDAQMWGDDEKIRANGHGNHDKLVEVEAA
jgi:hypothetical protein